VGHLVYQQQQQFSVSQSRPTSLRLRNIACRPLNYFIPDWEDYLDPDYDFLADRFSWDSGERKRLYAHELFKNRPLYDGILISLGHIFMGKGFVRNGLKPNIELAPTRKYLHLRRQHLVMGDCGAFSYRHKIVPPFTVEDVVRLYTTLGVDIGASVDHIPFGDVEENGQLRPLKPTEIEGRIKLTTDLAIKFLAISSKQAKFVPMGVIQARSSDEYASLACEYINAGYQYIALGGLVPRKDDEILAITETVFSKINQFLPQSAPTIRVHLFGVLREGILARLKDLGVASFDSGSYLRKAWLRSDKNYLSSYGRWYSAIRVPYSSDPRFKKNALEKGISDKELQQLEKNCLEALRRYDKKLATVTDVRDTVLLYDGLLLRNSDTNDLRQKYEQTLKDTPWKRCNCPVCRTLGIEVIIFRGFNRNKRRGFHNTWVFYKRLKKLRRE
jgi:hypothetical protein